MSKLQVPSGVNYSPQGLVTVVVQDAATREVLMVGHMNDAALARTVETGDVWFWSRRRQELWHKGATSGNYLRAQEIRADCDGDALLVLAEPAGPTCHTGARSCFAALSQGEGGSPGAQAAIGEDSPIEEPASPAVLDSLFAVIEGRRRERPEGSYTTYLFDKGLDKICKKIGEEATEVVIAAKNASREEIQYEVADLFYHALVLLADTGTPPDAVWAELRRREGQTPRPRSR
ncbi:MAG: bifunctional phosphoribosyl-AMP cyclohydrolase/phosphoribosyl-ATP diphosphatase HisIE [Chloroflexota bacterium]